MPSTDAIGSSDQGTTTQANQQQQHNNLMQIDQVFEELLAKMEVLSVQNHYQGQYGVIGSNKDKDWTSPLTPPPPPPPPAFAASPVANSRSQQQQLQQQQQQLRSNATSGDEFDKNRTTTADQLEQLYKNQQDQQEAYADADVVDGRFTQHSPQQQHFYHHNQHAHQQFYQNKQQEQQQQQLQKLQQQQKQHLSNIGTFDGSTMAAVNASSVDKHAYAAAAAAAATTFNNNLFYCDPSPADDVTSPTIAELHFGGAAAASDTIDEIDEAMVQELSQRLQAELRAAKSRHLACTEVSLPWDLMPRIAREIIKMSEREPCGVRGCSIFIEFEDEPHNTRRIASFKVDQDTVSTFELYLTLKHDRSGWISLIPQFLRNLARSTTILISPDFALTKNKLYSCE